MEEKEMIEKTLLLCKILSAYLNQEKKDFSSVTKEDIQFFYQLSRKHIISALTYRALEYEDLLKTEDRKKLHDAFERLYMASLKKTILFDAEREKVYQFLNENKIKYLPLKGILICKEYPEYGIREFADNDILFDKKRAKDVKKFFVKNGYKVENYGRFPHDVYNKEPSLNFEMHRYLFQSSHYPLLSDYFSDPFALAHKKEGYEYEFPPETFYIYFLAHSYKHYTVSGFGLRTLIDIYIVVRHRPNMDKEYLEKELKKVHLIDFEKEMRELSFKLFGGKENEELTDKEKEILTYILSSGTYGTREHTIKHGIEDEEGKAKYVFRRLFPPLKEMKESHPIAFKTIVAIPFLYIIRLFKGLFKFKKVKAELKMVKEADTTKKC